MESPLSALYIVVTLAALIMLGLNAYLFLKSRKKEPDESQSIIHQRLDSLSKLMSDELGRNKEATLSVQKMINEQLEQNRQSTAQATLSVHQQVQNFTQGMTQLQETVKQVQDSVKGVASFQDIFKSPKLRGSWGELALEAILSQYFSKDMYKMQHYFKSGEAVDAALRLPNQMILPIDSKFNWENFEKMVNAENEIQKDGYRKTFLSDVKKKVDEIAAKYILPSEGTTDLALMYVPAETLYYEIINNIKEADIPSYARSKKVFLVSPNSFSLSVSAIMHWFRDVEFSKQTQDIMKRLARIATDGEKLGAGFARLGKHISDARSSYDDSEKRLSLMVDRVKNVIEIGEATKEKIEEIDIPQA